MRIAILNQTCRPLGGAGTYLNLVIPAFSRRGHDMALWHEVGETSDSDSVALPDGSPSWSVEALGETRALNNLREWRPDVLFTHGLSDPGVEAKTLSIAPAVFLAHAYYGTCISGAKTFKNPTTLPCSRTFGSPCLVNYYPRRCGGWSPVTMIREFRRQGDRLQLLGRYSAIVTLSSHMQQEYARHGLDATWIKGPAEPCQPRAEWSPHDEWRLLFAGRMDDLKGGDRFIDALPRVANTLARPLHVTFVGDGPARARWNAAATGLMSREPRVRIEFTGWTPRSQVDEYLAGADLLVLPSLWPEPFGLIGLEAGRHYVPVAAFAVGGIPDWLRPGVNGYLAPADPPTSAGLADAVVSCLKDPHEYARLRSGAAHVADEFSAEEHVDGVLRVLDEASGERAS